MRKQTKKPLTDYSAYHGGSWQVRTRSHELDCGRGNLWPAKGLNSEWQVLQEVMLYLPSKKPTRIVSPECVQHLRALDWAALRRELAFLARTYRREGVKVRWMRAEDFPSPFPPNLMFARDLGFVTPWGAILARMGSPVRAGEEKWAQSTLAQAGHPILAVIRGRGTFEGADALWLSPKEVLLGVGNRTNREGFRQLRELLAEFDVKAHAFSLPKKVQHLLGLLQFVDRRRALLRTDLASKSLVRFLRKRKVDLIAVPESEEVTLRQGMNVIVIRPSCVVMPTQCPQLELLYRQHGLKIAARVPVRQLLNAAGGLACATAPLARHLQMK